MPEYMLKEHRKDPLIPLSKPWLTKESRDARVWGNEPQDRRHHKEFERAAAIHQFQSWIDTVTKSRTRPQELLLFDHLHYEEFGRQTTGLREIHSWFDTVAKSRTEPPSLLLFDRRLDEEIERAKLAILDLRDNWDGDGSPGYAESTMNRAIRFLNTHVKQVFADSGRILIPRILPSDGGSIDLHWKEQEFELLVNVPATDDLAVSFYAEDFSDRSSVKGIFDHSSTSKLLINWLTEASA